ncbi:MAG: hypothetical protein ACRCSO_13320 [Sphingomonas sp.]
MIHSSLSGLVAAIMAIAAMAPQAAPPPPANPTAPAAANPLDALLNSAKPLTADKHVAPLRLQSATTANCKTVIVVEGGTKYTIDLAKAQALAVNTNLVVSIGGGEAVQMVFDGKEGAKQAADGEKIISDLNDKCG